MPSYVPLPDLTHLTEHTEVYDSEALISDSVSLVKLDSEIRVEVDGIGRIGLKVVRTSKKERAAICIPSDPFKVCNIRNDLSLRLWWEEWQHNINVSMGTVRDIGPVFFVLKKLITEDYANCYYGGEENETHLTLSGRFSNVATIGLHAGFQHRESGGFGFKSSPYIPGAKWTIFTGSLKGYVFSFAKFKLQAKRLFQ